MTDVLQRHKAKQWKYVIEAFYNFSLQGSAAMQWEACKKELIGKLSQKCMPRNIIEVITNRGL